MAERTARFTVNLAPEQMNALLRFAELHRWPLSTAAAVLIERALAEDESMQ
jgi:hypothetical protein